MLTVRDYFPDPGFPLSIRREAAQRVMSRHAHEFEELVVIAGGDGRHIGRDGEWNLSAGDVFVVPRDETHGYRRTKDLDVWNVLFQPARLPIIEGWLERLPGYTALFALEPQMRALDRGAGRLHLERGDMAEVVSLLWSLHSVLSDRGAGGDAMAIGLFLHIIGLLCRVYAKAPPPAGRRLLGLERAMGRLIRIEEPAPKLEELAALAGMSVSTFQRAWRRYVDRPPLMYRMEMQMERARVLLRKTDLSVKEVAGRVGFEDSNHFSRQFRRQEGAGPREWRQCIRML